MNDTLAGEKQLNDSLVEYQALAAMIDKNITDFENTRTASTVSEV